MFGKKASSLSGKNAGPEKNTLASAPVASASHPSSAPIAPVVAASISVPPSAPKAPAAAGPATISFTDPKLVTPDFMRAKQMLTETLLEQINFEALEKISKDSRKGRISDTVDTLIAGINVPLTAPQTALLKADLLNEVLGFGPLEALMNDPDVSDITFTSEHHLLNTIQKIISLVGRRVDETSPMVDARMSDGSRFNAIIPPLAIDGSLVSIRKFKKNKMPLSQYLHYGSMSAEMCKFLEICGNIRLNIIISGGTGSGKTTLLNALSGHIDPGERVITIEDAAELMMHQPHVLRLETRPANTEGTGEIGQRQLVKNALRMRPDRIILGEIRGDEVIDVLSAMNTGHDGSMATIHANTPRDCLSRLENLIMMSGIAIPLIAMRQQISSAVNLVIQIARMRDGGRRITHIEEIVGMEGEIMTTQTLFGYQPGPMDANGKLTGKFYCSGIRPRFLSQAQYFNRDKEMVECINGAEKTQ